MGLMITGAILYVIGKIAHIGLIEKLGYYMIIGGGLLFILGFVGIGISLPFVGGAI